MPKQNKIFTDFSGGEWSSKLEGRIDTPGYYKSCRILEGFIVAGQGGAERRPGTAFVANGKTDADKVRLIPFELASGNYVLELGDAYMRFYKDHAQLEDAGNPVNIVTPWAKEDLFEIKYIQTADAMYFFHTGYQAQKLTWTSDTVWNIANVAWAGVGVPEFTTADNRPGAGGFFDQRMWLAGTNNKPDYIWGSAPPPASKEDFNSTDGLTFMVYYDKRFKIHWLAARQQIVFGATRGEGILSGGGAPISSTNFDLSVPSPIGNANIQGIVVGDIFVSFHKGLKKVLAFQYSNDVQSWKPTDLTFLSSHILGDGIVEADLQVDPDTILWCVTSDGQLVGFTYEPGATAAWHSHPIGQSLDGNDKVESDAVITGTTEDEIWISVKRKVNGTIKRFIEYFKPRSFGSDQKDCYFVDCGITWDGGDAATITDITQADPPVVTSAAHPFDDGDMVKITDVVESDEGLFDISTFVEIDEGGAITLAATTATVVGMARDDDELAYKSLGHEFLDGAFTYTFQFNRTAPYPTAGQSMAGTWGVADVANYLKDITDDENNALSFIARRAAGGDHKFQMWELYEGNIETVTFDLVVASPFDYYVKAERTIVGGANDCGEFTISIYSDAGMTVLLETKTIDLHTIAKYSYIYAVQNYHDALTAAVSHILTNLSGPANRSSYNYNVFTVDDDDAADTFTLDDEDDVDINGYNYKKYISGGKVQKVEKEVTGLDHLEGEIVQVLADGAAHPDKTVSGLSITLDRYANKIHVGLGYKSKLKPMRLTPPGVKKAAFKAIIRVYDSLGCKIGRSEDTLKVITFRAGTDPMDSAPPLFTGDKTKILTHSWDTDGDILIVQDQPLPLNIAALIVEMETNTIS